MTKLMAIFCLITLASCAHHRGPASIEGHPVAYDSMALGNVQASAIKRSSNQEVCFDINLKAKDVKVEQAQANNWTMAWVDSQGKYHLIPVTQRNPAAAPEGGAVVTPYGVYNEFSNDFTSCVSKAQYSDIKGLVLTPKELPIPKRWVTPNLERINDTHSIAFGYFIWFFGFTGAHRFYYGKPLTGTLWFLTFGLLGVGWLIDFFLIPSMEREAELKFIEGPINYSICWVLLTYLGIFGVHRFYMGKWISGILWLLTGGIFTLGYLYDFWTLNQTISEQNLLENKKLLLPSNVSAVQ